MSASSLTHLGIAHAQKREFTQAADYFRQAVTADPLSAQSHINLGNVLAELGDFPAAKASYSRALSLQPNAPDLHFNFAVMLTRLEDHAAAALSYQRAIQLAPNYAAAHSKLGVALARLGRHAEATASLRRALALTPTDAEAHGNLGTALSYAGEHELAFQSYEEALRLQPNHLDARCNYGVALLDAGRLAESKAQFDAVLRMYPHCVDAHMSRAVVSLTQGDFSAGFLEYQWRLRDKTLVRCQHAAPLWDGSPLAGKTLLLEAEQGLGDTIQFVRYAAEIRRLHPAARILLAVEKPLFPLLRDIAGPDLVLPQNHPRPSFDIWAPLMSLPGILQHDASSFPARVPYLPTNPSLAAKWRERLANLGGRKIGISWQGSKQNRSDRRRSFPLSALAPVANVPGVTLISLQKGVTKDELASLANFPVVHLGDDFDTAGRAFLDTVAVMQNLDLVITADTSIGHIAGALAIPTFLALAHPCDWRWLTSGHQTPWYPTHQLFRQPRPSDWPAVFHSMATTLATGNWPLTTPKTSY